MSGTEIETVDQLLEAWDKGESIWSIEMGGLGPGYEQAIQVAAVEFARVGKDYSPDPEDNYRNNAEWEKLCSTRLSEIDKQLGGLSGAQFSAASWLAYQWCHGKGPKGLQDKAKTRGKDDRCIQVSKFWPKVGEE